MPDVKSDFEKIENESERDKYWQAVVDQKINLLSQLSNGNTVTLSAVVKTPGKLIVTCAHAPLPESDPNIFINFDALRDRLFVKTKMARGTDGHHFISTTADLFRLQRRENFRITIPEDDPLAAYVNQLGDKNVKVKARVVDLSLGGVLLELPEIPHVVMVGDWISGVLGTDKDVGIQFKGSIPHIRDLKKDGKKRAGVRFDKLVGNGLTELNKLVMKYYHKMFSKFSRF